VTVAEHPPTSHQGEFLAFVLPLSAGNFWKTPSPSPFGQRIEPHPHQRQIATKGGNELVAICRNLSPFAAAHLPPFAAISRRLLSHGRLTPWLNQGFLTTQRPRFGRGVERC
jgi:hypothetical protein